MKTLLLVLFTVSFAKIGMAAGFQGVGDIPGGTYNGGIFSLADGISRDGATVVGVSSSADAGGNTEAFRWTPSGGIVGLGDIPGSSFNSGAVAASFDGSIVVGTGSSVSGGEAFRWTISTGVVGIGDLAGGIFSSGASDVSSDGSTIVGWGHSTAALSSPNKVEAFRWTAGSGMVGLGSLPGGNSGSEAAGVSADGSVVVGYSNTPSGDQAFRWTSGAGMVGLGLMLGGTASYAVEVSDDGSVVVGWGSSASGFQAFRWTLASGIVGLGDLSGGGFSSSAGDVSGDGSIVVGQAESASGSEAFIWDSVHGMRSLKNVLISEYGMTEVQDWLLVDARGISADGLTIAGNGVNPSGKQEAWVVTVPEPTSAIMLLCGAAICLRCRSHRTTSRTCRA